MVLAGDKAARLCVPGGLGYLASMNPVALLFLLFLLVPLAEIYLLIVVGGWIGALPTVFLVVFTAVLGALLLRHQGFWTLQRVRRAMERGQVPAVEMLEGVMLVAGGALLLTPGFITDVVGFACLLPPLRRRVAVAWLRRYLVLRPHDGPGPGGPSERGPRTLEGEWRREDE